MVEVLVEGMGDAGAVGPAGSAAASGLSLDTGTGVELASLGTRALRLDSVSGRRGVGPVWPRAGIWGSSRGCGLELLHSGDAEGEPAAAAAMVAVAVVAIGPSASASPLTAFGAELGAGDTAGLMGAGSTGLGATSGGDTLWTFAPRATGLGLGSSERAAGSGGV